MVWWTDPKKPKQPWAQPGAQPWVWPELVESKKGKKNTEQTQVQLKDVLDDNNIDAKNARQRYNDLKKRLTSCIAQSHSDTWKKAHTHLRFLIEELEDKWNKGQGVLWDMQYEMIPQLIYEVYTKHITWSQDVETDLSAEDTYQQVYQQIKEQRPDLLYVLYQLAGDDQIEVDIMAEAYREDDMEDDFVYELEDADAEMYAIPYLVWKQHSTSWHMTYEEWQSRYEENKGALLQEVWWRMEKMRSYAYAAYLASDEMREQAWNAVIAKEQLTSLDWQRIAYEICEEEHTHQKLKHMITQITEKMRSYYNIQTLLHSWQASSIQELMHLMCTTSPYLTDEMKYAYIADSLIYMLYTYMWTFENIWPTGGDMAWILAEICDERDRCIQGVIDIIDTIKKRNDATIHESESEQLHQYHQYICQLMEDCIILSADDVYSVEGVVLDHICEFLQAEGEGTDTIGLWEMYIHLYTHHTWVKEITRHADICYLYLMKAHVPSLVKDETPLHTLSKRGNYAVLVENNYTEPYNIATLLMSCQYMAALTDQPHTVGLPLWIEEVLGLYMAPDKQSTWTVSPDAEKQIVNMLYTIHELWENEKIPWWAKELLFHTQSILWPTLASMTTNTEIDRLIDDMASRIPKPTAFQYLAQDSEMQKQKAQCTTALEKIYTTDIPVHDTRRNASPTERYTACIHILRKYYHHQAGAFFTSKDRNDMIERWDNIREIQVDINMCIENATMSRQERSDQEKDAYIDAWVSCIWRMHTCLHQFFYRLPHTISLYDLVLVLHQHFKDELE